MIGAAFSDATKVFAARGKRQIYVRVGGSRWRDGVDRFEVGLPGVPAMQLPTLKEHRADQEG